MYETVRDFLSLLTDGSRFTDEKIGEGKAKTPTNNGDKFSLIRPHPAKNR